MTGTELRNQELGRHEEKVDRNIEYHQAVNLDEKQRRIAAANQNSSVAGIVKLVYLSQTVFSKCTAYLFSNVQSRRKSP